jgi:hypothetical protein
MPVFQTVMDGAVNDVAYRAFRNSLTGTTTATISIAKGAPVILETHSASNNGAWGRAAATKTTIEGNFYLGNAHAAVLPDSVGLVQCYGVDDDAIVVTAGATVGTPLVPNSTGLDPVTATTATPGAATGVWAVVVVAPSGAATAATKVFVRAL